MKLLESTGGFDTAGAGGQQPSEVAQPPPPEFLDLPLQRGELTAGSREIARRADLI